MRPKSIRWFDRLFWTYIAVRPVYTIVAASERLARLSAVGRSTESAIASTIESIFGTLAVSLVIWYFISCWASNIAKWIWVVLLVIALLIDIFTSLTNFANPAIPTPGVAEIVLYIIIVLLQIAVTVMLFRPDADAWFANGGKDVDPDIVS